MEEYIQVSAKTKNEAITKAAIELGTASDELDIVVVSEGSSGFFGIGSKPAIIKARKKQEEIREEESLKELEKEVVEAVNPAVEIKKERPSKRHSTEHREKTSKPQHRKEEKEHTTKSEVKEKSTPAREKTVSDKVTKEKAQREKVSKEKPLREKPAKEKTVKQTETLTDPVEIQEIEGTAKKFLEEVFAAMNLEVEIKISYDKEDGCLGAEFLGEDMGILIGKRGQTLDSLQYLTSLVVNKNRQGYIRVKLDTEDYRRRRKETLENLARGIAYKVKKTRKPVVLEPMNPYERRIIHSALQGNKFVETTSEGEEPYRHVVVKLRRERS